MKRTKTAFQRLVEAIQGKPREMDEKEILKRIRPLQIHPKVIGGLDFFLAKREVSQNENPGH